MLVAVLNRLILLQPGREELYRDRGMAYAQWGVSERALSDLERYAPAAQAGGRLHRQNHRPLRCAG
jgi:regulator of sirC expression with transglutaminase-like and TPR domain